MSSAEARALVARALPATPPERVRVLKVRYAGLVLDVTLRGGRRLVLKSGGASYDAGLEAAMLGALAEAGLRVPQVDDVRDDILVLARCEGRPIASADDWLAAAAALRRLHAATRGPRFGWDHDTLFGALRQGNRWSTDWRHFFGERRLLPLVHDALVSRRLPAADAARIEACWRMHAPALDGVTAAGLIHGDIWRDNVLMTAEGPLFLDPACFHADPGYERAFVLTYAPFAHRLAAAWQTTVEDGTAATRIRGGLYRLSFHLAHLLLFGRPCFLAAVRRTLTALEGLEAIPAARRRERRMS
jgi:fructosamine-3-kinase